MEQCGRVLYHGGTSSATAEWDAGTVSLYRHGLGPTYHLKHRKNASYQSPASTLMLGMGKCITCEKYYRVVVDVVKTGEQRARVYSSSSSGHEEGTICEFPASPQRLCCISVIRWWL